VLSNVSDVIDNIASVDTNVGSLPTGELGVKSNLVRVKVAKTFDTTSGASSDGAPIADDATVADKANLKTGVASALLPVAGTMAIAMVGAGIMFWRSRREQ
jgi:hypothetical protein